MTKEVKKEAPQETAQEETQTVNVNGWSDVFGYDDEKAEKGVWFEYPGNLGSFHLAMLGNKSRAFASRFEALAKPHRRKIELGDKKLEREITIRAFVEKVLLGWKNVHDEGKNLVFSQETAIALLTKYPKLLDRLVKDSDEEAAFRTESNEADAKNSPKS